MIKIAIDAGASLTKIYRAGKGIQLVEPSCFAVNTDSKRIRAVGKEALECMQSDSPFALHYPFRAGEVVDEKGAVILLRRFLEKIALKGGAAENVHALFLVPCGIRGKTCAGYYRVGQSLGFGKISFLETPYAVAEGLSLDWEEPTFLMDLGASLTTVALLTKEGLISGFALGVGGKDFDRAISKHIFRETDLHVSLADSEKLKNEVASLFDGDAMTGTVTGRRSGDSGVYSLSVKSENLVDAVVEQTDVIVRYTKMLLQKIPESTLSAVFSRGLNLSGGVSHLPGLKEYLEQNLGVETFVHGEKGKAAAILGAGKILESAALLKEYEVRY